MEEIDFHLNDVRIDVTLEITRACPLNCVICSSNGGKKHLFELSLDKWLEIIEESIELGAKTFLLSGGEPFNCSYFKDICEYISDKKSSLLIYTSGNYFDGREIVPLPYNDLGFLSNLNPARLVFSLGGSTERIHDSMTLVKGSFNNTLSSIKEAVDLGILTELHFVPTKMNFRELSNVVTLAKNVGVNKVSVLRFVAQGRGKDFGPQLKLSKDDLIHLRDLFNQVNEFGEFVRIGSPFNPFLLSKNYKCTAGRNRMTIRYDGRVVPCEALKFMAENFNDNDIKKYSLADIWNTSRIFQMARSFHKSMGSECNDCDFLSRCWGGCPAQKILNGSLENVDPYCAIRIGALKLISI